MNQHYTRPEAYLERRRPPPSASNDPREVADAEHAAALSFAIVLIIGGLSFGAGALALAATAVLIVWLR